MVGVPIVILPPLTFQFRPSLVDGDISIIFAYTAAEKAGARFAPRDEIKAREGDKSAPLQADGFHASRK
jgi:hypothetical protein